jgi:uncharacterized membrane protein
VAEPDAPAEALDAAEDAVAVVPTIVAVPQGGIAIPVGMQATVPMGATIQAVAVQQVQSWQGPFPPPEAIERYEGVLAGSFDRLLKMAEQQQSLTFDAATHARDLLQKDTSRGHWFGFLLALLAIIGAVACSLLGNTAVAIALLGVPLLSVAKAFVDSASGKSVVQVQAVPAVAEPEAKALPPESEETKAS